ncbi:MAG: hypothetical protein AMJ53_12570, partial [Gammaproteobacteria bacterium SG8_11]
MKTIAILHIRRPGDKLGERKQLTRLWRNINIQTGDYTRLTRLKPGVDTTSFGALSHSYPEEILILEGNLVDAAFDKWLMAGDYASRP